MPALMISHLLPQRRRHGCAPLRHPPRRVIFLVVRYGRAAESYEMSFVAAGTDLTFAPLLPLNL